MKLPRLAHINGRAWSFRQRRLKDAYGQCDYDNHRIEYRPDMCHDEKRDVILHELLHAVRHMQGHEYDETEEHYVRSLATGLIGIFNDNPKLAEWLIHKGHHEQTIRKRGGTGGTAQGGS